jgi:hypothetical protein
MRRHQPPVETGPTSNVWDDYEAALAAYSEEPTPKAAANLEALRQIYRRRLAVEAWRASGPRGYPWEA